MKWQRVCGLLLILAGCMPENLRGVLEDAGSSLEQVVRVTCFMADASAFPILNTLFGEYFPSAPPARSTPVVALPKGLLFSIDAIALVVREPGA